MVDNTTTRRAFLTTTAAAALGGCTSLASDDTGNGDDPTPDGDRDDTATPEESLITPTGMLGEQGEAIGPAGFAHRPVWMYAYSEIPREAVAFYPEPWRQAGVPETIRPRAGRNITAVVMHVTNRSDSKATPPSQLSRFGVFEARDGARKVWEATTEPYLRPPGGSDLEPYNAPLTTDITPIAGVSHGLGNPNAASGEPVEPGDSVLGLFIAETPAAAEPASLHPALGVHTDGAVSDVSFPTTWRTDATGGEPTEQSTDSNA